MKRILVTDPCYLISHKDWDDLCETFLTGVDGSMEHFRKAVEALLRKESGDQKAVAADTGFGDWVNSIDGETFYADSGMVCVVEDTTKLREYIFKAKDRDALGLGVAHLEVSDDAWYKIDTMNPHWSVVEVLDGNRIIKSEPYEDEEI